MSKTKGKELAAFEPVEPLIREIRDERVILDSDLARLYRVPTKVLNQAVKRNADRFPPGFLFRLTESEAEEALRSRSQLVTLKRGQNIKYLPYALTEHGAIMAANVLSSPRAVEMSIYVIRAFIKMRAALAGQANLARRLAEIEKTLTGHDAALRNLYNKIRPLLLPPPETKRREIGFHVKDSERSCTKAPRKAPD